VLRMTDAFNQVVLGSSRVQRIARKVVIGTLTRVPRTRRLMREMLSGIGIAYAHKRDDDPMVGRRLPDIDIDGARLYELLREGKFVLVTATPVELGRPDIVHVVGRHPEIPDAVLVRPDSYLAWAADRVPSASELVAAIDNWSR
jgi:hypothetical protein